MGTYRTSWAARWLVDGAESIPEMVQRLREEADDLEAMHHAGICLEEDSAVNDGHAELVTDDPAVAIQFGLEEDQFDDDDFSDGGDGDSDLSD